MRHQIVKRFELSHETSKRVNRLSTHFTHQFVTAHTVVNHHLRTSNFSTFLSFFANYQPTNKFAQVATKNPPPPKINPAFPTPHSSHIPAYPPHPSNTNIRNLFNPQKTSTSTFFTNNNSRRSPQPVGFTIQRSNKHIIHKKK